MKKHTVIYHMYPDTKITTLAVIQNLYITTNLQLIDIPYLLYSTRPAHLQRDCPV
jgi:hypothetical protein